MQLYTLLPGIPPYRPVGDSMPAEAYPEAVDDGEDEAGGMMDPVPLELLPGLGHFLYDFFSFIQGNSWAIGPVGVTVAGAGAWPVVYGCWAAPWCVWRPLVAEALRFCWLLAAGLGWLAVQGLKLGMVCSKGGGITVDSLIDEVWNDSRTAGKDVRHSARDGWLFMKPISLSNSKFIALSNGLLPRNGDTLRTAPSPKIKKEETTTKTHTRTHPCTRTQHTMASQKNQLKKKPHEHVGSRPQWRKHRGYIIIVYIGDITSVWGPG